MTAATATLTLGLVLHGVTDQPFAHTQAATRGPDVVAESSYLQPSNATSPADLAALGALARHPGVAASSGPYPMTTAVVRAHGVTVGADVEGRSPSAAAVDQPKVTTGTWVRPGGVVVERSFAYALGLHVGSPLSLNGRAFRVVGEAVTTAFSPYPELGCLAGCSFGPVQLDAADTGLMWAMPAAAESLATKSAPLTYYLNLRLTEPSRANDFANSLSNNYNGVGNPSSAPFIMSAQQVARHDANLVRNEQTVILIGSWLLAILAVASLAVLVGGRMADQMRRVGLLKAIGGTPGLVATVLMAEYLAVALLSAAAGLILGRLFAPLLTGPGYGLLGAAPAPPMSLSTIAVVAGVALAVAVVAALVPAVRAARTSTVRALADSARAPKRTAWLIALSARLPVPLLIAVRMMSRRVRRTVLSMLSVFVTVSGIVAVTIAHERLNTARFAGTSGLINPRTMGANHVLLLVTVMLIALAGVNAVFITRAIAVDARHASAITRALGATPEQVTAGLSAAQIVPALTGALLGIPGGIALYNSVRHGDAAAPPPGPLVIVAIVIGAVLVVTILTAIPARLAARRPVAEILQTELA
jgi:ABC-type antimicrobial peptide transport system permease subunit